MRPTAAVNCFAAFCQAHTMCLSFETEQCAAVLRCRRRALSTTMLLKIDPRSFVRPRQAQAATATDTMRTTTVDKFHYRCGRAARILSQLITNMLWKGVSQSMEGPSLDTILLIPWVVCVDQSCTPLTLTLALVKTKTLL